MLLQKPLTGKIIQTYQIGKVWKLSTTTLLIWCVNKVKKSNLKGHLVGTLLIECILFTYELWSKSPWDVHRWLPHKYQNNLSSNSVWCKHDNLILIVFSNFSLYTSPMLWRTRTIVLENRFFTSFSLYKAVRGVISRKYFPLLTDTLSVPTLLCQMCVVQVGAKRALNCWNIRCEGTSWNSPGLKHVHLLIRR